MTTNPTKRPGVLFFDTGLGGFSVLKAMIAAYPTADYTYLADNARFPYGELEPDAVIARVEGLVTSALAKASFDLCVIACNTASTLVLPALRKRFAMPFVGTVPAIKPAAIASESGMVSVLATPGTVKRDYTRQLIDEFAANCEVTLVGAKHLAPWVEQSLMGQPLDEKSLRAEIAPAFVRERSRQTDVIVLACTHYPLILPTLERLAPWPVTWIDAAPAIADHAARQLAPMAARSEPSLTLLSTAARPWPRLGPILGPAQEHWEIKIDVLET